MISFQIMGQNTKTFDTDAVINDSGDRNAEEASLTTESDKQNLDRQDSGSWPIEGEEHVFQDNTDGKSRIKPSSGSYQALEAKVATLLRKNGNLEGQLASALAAREAAEKNLSSALRSRQEMERRLGETTKEVEMLREKVATLELAQEEANSLSNIVHSDNVRLEHDVAFLKAVLDDTQKVCISVASIHRIIVC